MKTNQIKQSFIHVFADGKANGVELARVFLIIAAPALIYVITRCIIEHFNH